MFTTGVATPLSSVCRKASPTADVPRPPGLHKFRSARSGLSVRIGAVVEIFFARGVRFFSELWLVSADFQQKGESGGAKLTTPAKRKCPGRIPFRSKETLLRYLPALDRKDYFLRALRPNWGTNGIGIIQKWWMFKRVQQVAPPTKIIIGSSFPRGICLPKSGFPETAPTSFFNKTLVVFLGQRKLWCLKKVLHGEKHENWFTAPKQMCRGEKTTREVTFWFPENFQTISDPTVITFPPLIVNNRHSPIGNTV